MSYSSYPKDSGNNLLPTNNGTRQRVQQNNCHMPSLLRQRTSNQLGAIRKMLLYA